LRDFKVPSQLFLNFSGEIDRDTFGKEIKNSLFSATLRLDRNQHSIRFATKHQPHESIRIPWSGFSVPGHGSRLIQQLGKR
jgi:hypothetical protein